MSVFISSSFLKYPSIFNLSRAMSSVAGLHGRNLQQPWLLCQQSYINGRFVDAASGDTLDVVNPASGKLIGTVPAMGAAETQEAIDAAHAAFQTWKRTTAKERSILLRKWFNLLEEHKEDLSMILTAEAGKPLAESRGEMGYGASFIEWFAEEAKRINGEVVQSPMPNREMINLKQPIGVAGMITPWNFPNAMITRKAGAALAAGCTCVVKPAEDTPYSALALAVLAERAGIPPGVFNVITCKKTESPAVGNLLCTSDKVAGISFTGSTGVGRTLYQQCSAGIKRMGLELGGNAPFIVFDSANLDVAINALMVAKFRNAGQTCISANRILVQSDVYDEFLQRALTAVGKLVVGDGLDEGVTVGPLINAPQLKRVSEMVAASVAAGARVECGGKAMHGLYYEPTVLTGVTQNMPCSKQEIFGPVVAIAKFDTEEEALSLANDCKSGLAGYFFSQNASQVWRVARELEVGMIGINEGLISAAEAAFGGIKESGLGREGSSHGIDEYIEIKYLCQGSLDK